MTNSKNKYGFFTILQLLSIDVIIGTLAIGFMATKLLRVTANTYWWIVLPLTVWVVYSLDHVIDSFKNKNAAVIARHRYHYTHKREFILAIITISIISLALSLLFLDKEIIKYGVLLSSITGIYLALIYLLKKRRFFLFQKEILIAAVYTIGIFLAPLIWHRNIPPYPVILVIINIFLLAWIEGVMISWFEYEDDLSDGHTSFATMFGRKNTRLFLIATQVILAVITKLSILYITTTLEFTALIITIVMDIILFVVIMNSDKLFIQKYYRTIGELVFILPILIILVP